MPNTTTYTGYFRKRLSITKHNYKLFQPNFIRFDKYYKENVPTNGFGHIEWKYDNESDYDHIYNNIIISLARYFNIKVMFRCLLNEHDQPTLGYWFIGDTQRISIAYHIWDYIYPSLVWYRKPFKKITVSKKNSSSIKFNQYINDITNVIDNLLEIDIRYTQYLEKFILNSYKLNFKNYRTDNHLYDHAVSGRFHHKRLLL